MTLYLKYRPQNLDELDSEGVRESLKKIILSGRVPHAFLFSGPKGTGKTSAARILAKILNCRENQSRKDSRLDGSCGKCEQCTSITRGTNLDVVEIDAASHRGIDDIRLLREAVGLSPAKARKKVYIVDEAHMLTLEASNALLKTLEEPPEHVVFVLATTNPEKLIPTIRSRTTLINFQKATPGEIVRSLGRVIKGEKIKMDEASLKVIARGSDGSFRDAIKILEQAVGEEIMLDEKHLEGFIHQSGGFTLDEFIDLLAGGNSKALLNSIEAAVQKGVAIEGITESILERLRKALLAKFGVGSEDLQGFNTEQLVRLIELINTSLRDNSAGPIEQLPLELAIIKWCGAEAKKGSEHQPAPLNGSNETKDVSENKVGSEDGVSGESANGNGNAVIVNGQGMFSKIGDDIWKSILAGIRPLNASIEALLRAATPVNYDGKTLTLGVFYKFHKERLEDGHHRRILEDVVGKILHAPTRVICTLTQPPPKEKPVLTEGEDHDIIKIAEEIFSS